MRGCRSSGISATCRRLSGPPKNRRYSALLTLSAPRPCRSPDIDARSAGGAWHRSRSVRGKEERGAVWRDFRLLIVYRGVVDGGTEIDWRRPRSTNVGASG